MTGNTNRLLVAGFVILLLGIQLRLVQSYELNAEASRFIQERRGRDITAMTSTYLADWSLPAFQPRETITPPSWLGWSLISVGSVLILTGPRFKS